MRQRLAALLLLLSAATAAAEQVAPETPPSVPNGLLPRAAKNDEPIHVRANHVELDKLRGTVNYRGAVVVTQGDFTIAADRIEAVSRDGKDEALRAFGAPARAKAALASQPEETRLQAAEIEYQVATRVLELTGEAVVEQGSQRLTAHHIRYDLVGQDLRAKGRDAQRITAVYHPRKTPPR